MRATEIAAGRAQDELEKMIDDWRRQQSSIPSRALAVRMLVRKGLEADSSVVER